MILNKIMIELLKDMKNKIMIVELKLILIVNNTQSIIH